MGMLMPLILQLAKLCIIGFALVVQGSSGHNASPSPAKFSMFPSTEGIPGAVVRRSDTPSPLSQSNGSDLHSPPALPPLMSALVPETKDGHARSLSPSNSTKLLQPSTAPPPLIIEDHVPSLAPSTPVVLPPFDTAPPPLLVQVHTPSQLPTAPKKKEPVSKSPLSVPNAPGHAHSLSPSNSMQSPPPNTATPPFTIEDHIPSLAPSTPVVLPPFDTAPPPLLVQVHTPSELPTAPQKQEPVSKSPLSVPNAPGHARSLSPSNSMKSPLPNTAPPPFTVEDRVPSLAPNTPVVLPPFETAPPPLPVQVHTTPESPTAPQKKEPVSKSPLSVPNAPGHARSLLPSNSMKSPPANTAPPPFTIEDHVPSSAPSTPEVLPPFDTAPPPLLVQVHTPSELPAAPQKKEPVSKSPLSKPNAPGHAHSLSPSNSMKSPPPKTAPPPLLVQVHTPSELPAAPQKKEPVSKSPLSVPNAPGHVHSLSPRNSMKPPPPNEPPPPFTIEDRVPSLAPNTPVVLPPFDTAPPPLHGQVQTPAESPTAPQKKEPVGKSPLSVPNSPAPLASPSRNLPQNSPPIHPFPSITPSQNSPENSPVVRRIAPPLRNSPQNSPSIHSSRPSAFPPIADQRNSSNNKAPVLKPTAPGPVAPQLRNSPQNPPAVHPSRSSALAPTPSANQGNSSNNRAPVMEPIAPAPVATPWINSPRNQTAIHSRGPTTVPPSAPIPKHSAPVSVAPPPRKLEMTPPPVHSIKPPLISPDPVSTPPSSINWNDDGIPVASPKNKIHKPVPPVNYTSQNGFSPAIPPSASTTMRHPANSPIPSLAPLNKGYYTPALSPSISFHKHQHTRNERTSPAPASSYLISPPPLKQQVPVISPTFLPGRRRRHYAPAPLHSVSPSHSTGPSSVSRVSPVPSPSPITGSRQTKMPLISPKVSSSVSPLRSPKVPPPPPLMSFPPPPPNADCSTTICTEPYTTTPPGSPCICVLPMQVGLSLSVALYTFFPLVSELAQEIATGVFMKQSQVRIMGANAPTEQPEKTVVLIDLVPLGEKFDSTTAFLTYLRFWHKQVAINTSLFGDYTVLYVRYLGLPPSPPLPPSVAGIADAGPYPGNDNNARAIKPLGVDVHGKQHKYLLSGGVISIIVLSMLVAVVLCSAIAWFLLFKRGDHASQQAAAPQHLPTSLAKPLGSVGSMVGSGQSSTSLSFSSSIVAYTGSAKTFSASDIEKATDNFDASRILGEGGFGRVYSGVLEEGTEVAVKVLKRDDQQGGREFLAEVEMLSRLHHRNLVKLIGICTEERNRCLVYELIPNGSVESHLHGVDKESAPLDWDARIKIALGAARGLAYLHEDSSPRVIHRDFKSSNILLEHDFTPKVSDFGLARTAMDEEGRHISTRVMGTFGYVAPEYAMTGHLLVKSDVYSYGVVLLELLTGRKPVDMTQPPGQENLVAWARPLLVSKEGLETIIDPSLGSDVPFDSVAKVAAIASMCVQPEVSHRPFMGEVVQALKLVCNECGEAKAVGSRGSSQDDISIDLDAKVGTGSGQLTDPLQSHYSIPNYDSGLDPERGLSVSELFSSSARIGRQSSGSFRRHCSSGPLRRGRGSRFWQKMQRLSRGSISEHGNMIRFWPGSH